MKKKISILGLTLLLMTAGTLLTVLAYLPPSPCYPDQPNDLWIGPFYECFTPLSCPHCDICVEWYYRTTTNPVWYDINITSIYVYSIPCSCNFDDVLKDAIIKLFDDNKMLFPIRKDGCSELDWRASLASCWKTVIPEPIFKNNDKNDKTLEEPTTGPPPNFVGYHVQCDVHSCCLARYHLCWDNDGKMISCSTTYVSNYPDSCQIYGCSYKCDDLFIGYIYSIKPNTPKDNNQLLSQDGLCNLIKNQETGNDELIISNKHNGQVRIEVHSIEGELITTQLVLKELKDIRVIFNSEKLEKGPYIINVLIDDIQICVFKFLK